MTILVTGGTGYIGSHTVVELHKLGFDVVIIDNLSNSNSLVLDRIEHVSGKRPLFVKADIRDLSALNNVFKQYDFESVIHFAGLKAVGESVSQPMQYYDNNVVGSLRLIEAMEKAKVKNFVFSSSATVYGSPERLPLDEECKLQSTNPYGNNKLHIEQMLFDVCKSDPNWSVIALRYFNPIGAHESGMIGEDPRGIPNNLVPFISQVATGRLTELSIFGNDYDTLDGTGVRDYIHVTDLALGHVKALELFVEAVGFEAINLGTGNGYSVLEMIACFEKVNNISIPYKICGRRPGDISSCYAKANKAFDKLGWKAKKNISEMLRDAWNWQSKNPTGYN